MTGTLALGAVGLRPQTLLPRAERRFAVGELCFELRQLALGTRLPRRDRLEGPRHSSANASCDRLEDELTERDRRLSERERDLASYVGELQRTVGSRIRLRSLTRRDQSPVQAGIAHLA